MTSHLLKLLPPFPFFEPEPLLPQTLSLLPFETQNLFLVLAMASLADQLLIELFEVYWNWIDGYSIMVAYMAF